MLFFSSDIECKIPKIQNGSFIVIGTESSKSDPIKSGATVTFICDKFHELNTEYSNISCEGGKWNQKVPKCIRKYSKTSNANYIIFNLYIAVMK